MTTHTTTANAAARPTDSGRWLIWTAGLVVAAGAAIATAHGLYRVALAATVPPPVAWLYPLITDGLALVAYAATTRLAAGGRRYAWAVVVLAAGLSGLAQASYLAIGVHSAPTQLRFGVGAWPAVAAAIAAHLLYLLAARPGTVRPDTVRPDPVRPEHEAPYDAVRPVRPVRPGTVRPAVVQVGAVPPARTGRPAGTNDGPGVVQLSGPVPAAGSDSADDDSDGRDGPLTGPDGPDAAEAHALPGAYDPVRADQPVRPDVVQHTVVRAEPVRPVRPDDSQQPAVVRPEAADPCMTVPDGPLVRPAVCQPVRPEEAGSASPYESAADRARAAAVVHRVQHGGLPTVSELIGLADVGRGTAGLALKRLRDEPAGKRNGLQVVPDADAGTRR